MQYVRKILLQGEKVLYGGKVSPVIYLPGLALLAVAWFSADKLPGLDRRSVILYKIDYHLSKLIPLTYAAEVITGLLLTAGIALMIRAWIISSSTELAVTDRRVIAKFGVASTVTTEIDRRKIAGVIITQSPLGKLMNYGRITLRGYSGDISNMPPLSRPYDFQKQVNARVRW